MGFGAVKSEDVMVTPLGLHLRVCEGGTPTSPYAKANAGTTQRRSEKDATSADAASSSPTFTP